MTALPSSPATHTHTAHSHTHTQHKRPTFVSGAEYVCFVLVTLCMRLNVPFLFYFERLYNNNRCCRIFFSTRLLDEKGVFPTTRI